MNLIASTKDSSLTVRMPKDLLSAVKEAARSSGRSQNTEIVFRLAHSLGIRPTEAPSSHSDATVTR